MGTWWVPRDFMGSSRRMRRLSRRMPRALSTASAMLAAVTEPKSLSSSPVRASMVITLLLRMPAISSALSARRLSLSSVSAISRRASSSLLGVATSASPRGTRKLRT